MAQTKRKRRTKHRGNAAGGIEARGRTGRKPTVEEKRGRGPAASGGRRRVAKPPSWNSAVLKALAMALCLFTLTQLHVIGKSTSVTEGILLGLLALVLYTPLAYLTDRWVYNRQQKNLGKS